MKIDINSVESLPGLHDIRHLTSSRSGFDPVPVETLVGMYFESLEYLERYHEAVANLHKLLVDKAVLGASAPAPAPIDKP